MIKKYVPALVLLALAVALFVCLGYLEYLNPRTDFRTFYTAAVKLKTGEVATLYNVSDYPESIPFLRPAWQALMYYPLAYLSYRDAYFVYLMFNLTVLGFCLWLLRDDIQALTPNRRLALALIIALPLACAITLGQDSALFVLLVVLAAGALRKDQDLRAGLWLGVASFKLHLLLPAFVLFLLRRQGRLLLSVGATGTFLLALSTWVAGPNWIGRCLEAQAATNAVPGLGTLRYLLMVVGVPELTLPLMLAGLSVVAWALRRAPSEKALTHMVFASVFLNWHAYLYDFLCVLPAWTCAYAAQEAPAGNAPVVAPSVGRGIGSASPAL